MECYNSIVINAPAFQIWDELKDFYNFTWSKNVIVKIDRVGNKSGLHVGAQRILNDTFHETLLSIEEEKKRFTYSIDDGPSAVSKNNIVGYVGKVRVYSISENDTSFVLWTSKWDYARKGGRNVQELCNPIYRALLSDLKLHFSNL